MLLEDKMLHLHLLTRITLFVGDSFDDEIIFNKMPLKYQVSLGPIRECRNHIQKISSRNFFEQLSHTVYGSNVHKISVAKNHL
jgi:hypothetical protein